MSLYSDLPFLHALGDGGPRASNQVVVIHATDNTASAWNEAQYATHRTDKTSAHFYVDDGQSVQALDTSRIAYGCLYHGNHISVQFELCGLSNRISDATMRRAAPIVARVCREFRIPVRKVSPDQVRGGVQGICGHDTITAAFPEDNGDHTDPGGSFPWATFLGYVNGDDMEQTDPLKYPTPNSSSRTVGSALTDLSNLRDWLIGAGQLVPGDGSWPHAGSPAAKLAASGQPVQVVMSQTDRDAIVAALLNVVPKVPTAQEIATAVLDEQHRRDEA